MATVILYFKYSLEIGFRNFPRTFWDKKTKTKNKEYNVTRIRVIVSATWIISKHLFVVIK